MKLIQSYNIKFRKGICNLNNNNNMINKSRPALGKESYLKAMPTHN